MDGVKKDSLLMADPCQSLLHLYDMVKLTENKSDKMGKKNVVDTSKGRYSFNLPINWHFHVARYVSNVNGSREETSNRKVLFEKYFHLNV